MINALESHRRLIGATWTNHHTNNFKEAIQSDFLTVAVGGFLTSPKEGEFSHQSHSIITERPNQPNKSNHPTRFIKKKRQSHLENHEKNVTQKNNPTKLKCQKVKICHKKHHQNPYHGYTSHCDSLRDKAVWPGREVSSEKN